MIYNLLPKLPDNANQCKHHLQSLQVKINVFWLTSAPLSECHIMTENVSTVTVMLHTHNFISIFQVHATQHYRTSQNSILNSIDKWSK